MSTSAWECNVVFDGFALTKDSQCAKSISARINGIEREKYHLWRKKTRKRKKKKFNSKEIDIIHLMFATSLHARFTSIIFVSGVFSAAVKHFRQSDARSALLSRARFLRAQNATPSMKYPRFNIFPPEKKSVFIKVIAKRDKAARLNSHDT